MRQRNVKNKKEIINSSLYIIPNPKDYCGKWHKVFGNNHPICLEIGMGKGDFIRENAKKNPNINYIGIEKFDSIMAIAIKKMGDEQLDNLKLIRMDAINITEVFNKEISKIYLNFSDPWPKARHEKRRLTSGVFLKKYDELFEKKCDIEIKTDNRQLFEYSIVSLNECQYKIVDINLNLHDDMPKDNIMTEYEKKFSERNIIIYYMKAVK